MTTPVTSAGFHDAICTAANQLIQEIIKEETDAAIEVATANIRRRVSEAAGSIVVKAVSNLTNGMMGGMRFTVDVDLLTLVQSKGPK